MNPSLAQAWCRLCLLSKRMKSNVKKAGVSNVDKVSDVRKNFVEFSSLTDYEVVDFIRRHSTKLNIVPKKLRGSSGTKVVFALETLFWRIVAEKEPCFCGPMINDRSGEGFLVTISQQCFSRGFDFFKKAKNKAGRKYVRSTPRYDITEIQVYSFWLSPFFSDSSIAS